MTKDIVGRRVKPLKWDAMDEPEGGDWLGHGTDTCQFYIRRDADTGTYLLPGDAYDDEEAEEYPTLEAAKAAAQTDFETRILSALESLSPPDGVGLTPAPADMRKPEDGGADPRYIHLSREGLVATIAERDRRIAELEAAGQFAVTKLTHAMQFAIGDADWRRRVDAARARLAALLSGQQDPGP